MESNNPLRHLASKQKKREPSWLRSRVLAAYCGVALALGSPALAHAQTAEELEQTDARLGGYDQTVKLDKSGVALTWMLFLFLSVVGCAVLFKNANRTHLD